LLGAVSLFSPKKISTSTAPGTKHIKVYWEAEEHKIRVKNANRRLHNK